MGREWLCKARGGGVDDGRGGKKSQSPSATATKPLNRRKNKNSSSSSCMSVIFNLFDIQHHQFRFHHPSLIPESALTNHQGIEAQRSSLDSPGSAVDGGPSSSEVKEQTNLNIPVGRIQIKTKRSRLIDDVSSECSSSPSTKTPNLVARLMGLDLLPEYSSPRPSSSSTPAISHIHHAHSLPATPRLSTASRRSTDNDYHHRLSLQLDKENRNSCRDDDDLKTQYAKQITNQVRERISRRLGTDITNTISREVNKDYRRDSNLVLLKPKKPTVLSHQSLLCQSNTPIKSKLEDSNHVLLKLKKSTVQSHQSFLCQSNTQVKSKPEDSTLVLLKPKKSTALSHQSLLYQSKLNTSLKSKPDDSTQSLSSSPKLRLLDIKSNLSKPISNSHRSKIKACKPPSMTPEKPVKDGRMKRIPSERYLKKKSTALQNHVLNGKNTTKFQILKKEMTSSSSTARSTQLQVSLPSNLNSQYKLKPPPTTTTNSFSDHFDYISRILNQCGITPTTPTPISIGQWHPHSHPLHPSIFHQLETLHHPAAVAAAAPTRRVIFELVDESLAEILNQKPDPCVVYGSDLIKKLCDQIGGFPAAHCEVLEDIDGLIERDMGRSTRWLVAEAEAEREDIVKEIESDIMEGLVNEIATETVAPARSDRVRSTVLFT